MALPSPTQPFVWGAGGAALTPEQVARQREIAQALMQGGMDYSPVDHWLQGAARAAQGGVGALKERWANEAEQTGRQGFQSQWDSIFGGGGQPTQVASVNPVASALMGGQPQTASDATAMMASGSAPISGDWLEYANQSATRNQPLAPELVSAMSFLPEMGVTMRVVSGGQDAEGPNRVGSTRHDHGNSGDVDFYQNGRKLDWNNQADLPILSNIVARARSNGITGIGAGDDYMGAGRFHIGFGNEAVWGAGGKSENAPEWLRAAYNGASPSSSGPRTQVAQAGGGQPSVAQLLSLAGNEWANPGQSSVVSALLNQQMQQQDPRYQQQLAMGELDMQRAQLELQALQNPGAPKPIEVGGVLLNAETFEPIFDSRSPSTATVGNNVIDTRTGLPIYSGAPEQTPGIQNYQFLTEEGFAPTDAAGRAFSGGININTGDQGPKVGAIPSSMALVPDPTNPTGFRMETIPGSPEAIAAEQAAAAAEIGTENTGRTANIVREDLGRIRDIVNNAPWFNPAVGFGADIAQAVAGSNATNVAALSKTVLANIGFDRLQQMRDASPTGGALGAISDRELGTLQSVMGNLEQSQSVDQFMYNLDRLGTIYDEILTKASAYPNASAFGIQAPAGEQQDQSQYPNAPTVGTVVEGYRYKGGSPGDMNSWEKVQ